MHRQVIEFSKYNPSGNMTILVHSKHHPNEYATIANQLMATTHVCCEQVGFIESTNHNNWETYHLVMSGNEFAGMLRCHTFIICKNINCYNIRNVS